MIDADRHSDAWIRGGASRRAASRRAAGRPRRGVRRRGYFVFQGDLFVGAARATRADDAAARGVRDATVDVGVGDSGRGIDGGGGELFALQGVDGVPRGGTPATARGRAGLGAAVGSFELSRAVTNDGSRGREALGIAGLEAEDLPYLPCISPISGSAEPRSGRRSLAFQPAPVGLNCLRLYSAVFGCIRPSSTPS